MSAKAIQEATGKELLNKFLNSTAIRSRFVSVDEKTNLNDLFQQISWLREEKLVIKPDQLIKRRGKLGLIKVGTDFNGVKEFIHNFTQKEFQVSFLGNYLGEISHGLFIFFRSDRLSEDSETLSSNLLYLINLTKKLTYASILIELVIPFYFIIKAG